MELEDEPVLRHAPRLREPGHGLEILVDAEERPEHQLGHAQGLLVEDRRRIERLRIADEVAGDRRGGPCGRLPATAGRGDDRGEHTEGNDTSTNTLHRWRQTE
jgi:hypothetical protein